jgi:hypothetical protein
MEIERSGVLLRFFVMAVFTAAGCSSSSGVGGSGGAGGATAGTGGAGGATATRDCTTDLSGTWDVSAMQLGSTTATIGVLTIGSDTFSLADASRSMVYSRPNNQLTYTPRSRRVHQLTVDNQPADVPVGSLPLKVGGTWTFTNGGEQCTVTVTSDAVTGSCQGSGPLVNSVDWPDLPTLSNGRTYTLTRSTTLASQFGVLGGAWTSSGARAGTCTGTLQGNRLTAQCDDASFFSGTLDVAVSADCVISGTTGSGVEISGRRR